MTAEQPTVQPTAAPVTVTEYGLQVAGERFVCSLGIAGRAAAEQAAVGAPGMRLVQRTVSTSPWIDGEAPLAPEREQEPVPTTGPICTQAEAHAAGLDIAPTTEELVACAETIVAVHGDTPSAEADLARAVPLMAAAIEQLRGAVVTARARALHEDANAVQGHGDTGIRIPLPGIPECPADCPCRRTGTAPEQDEAQQAGGAW